MYTSGAHTWCFMGCLLSHCITGQDSRDKTLGHQQTVWEPTCRYPDVHASQPPARVPESQESLGGLAGRLLVRLFPELSSKASLQLSLALCRHVWAVSHTVSTLATIEAQAFALATLALLGCDFAMLNGIDFHRHNIIVHGTYGTFWAGSFELD